MLTTFVIGLREGLEAALIVGIIAAFLKRNAPVGTLKYLWVGVGSAVAICLAGGIILSLISAYLPQRQQEMLECVIAAVAVVMISYMILWMNSHAKGLKGELESAAAGALARGSAVALVVMAFLAVLREGFETSVFLLAAFENSISASDAVTGIALGLAAAFFLGYLIYRGGTRINLSRFFRITGVVLVLVAAGLLMSTFRAAYEADWISLGRQPVFDLSWLVEKGSVQASVLGGILGIQPDPAVIEVAAWLLYVIPMMAIVLWPRKQRLSKVGAAKVLTTAGVVGAVVSIVLVLAAPSRPDLQHGNNEDVLTVGTGEVTSVNGEQSVSGTTRASVLTADNTTLTAEFTANMRSGGQQISISGTAPLTLVGQELVAGLSATRYDGKPVVVSNESTPAGLADTITGGRLQQLNNGRLPIGLSAADAQTPMAATYVDSWRPTVFYDRGSGVVIDVQLRMVRSLQVITTAGLTVSGGTIADLTTNFTADASVNRSVEVVAAKDDAISHQVWGQVIPALVGFASLVGLLAAGWLLGRDRSAAAVPVAADPPKVSV